MNTMMIQVNQLNKLYDKKQAINNLSFEIEEKTITGLIGRNGAGKTTLMRILAGQLEKTNGNVTICGGYPLDNLTVLSQTVYMYHNMGYGRHLTLNTILLNYKELFHSFDYEFAINMMRYFDLDKKMKFTALSQGMGSNFNFICALACRCAITILDEPVLGMDVTVRKAAYEILLKDYTEYPRTFLISSHLLNELEGILSDILLIDSGNLIFHDSIDIIRQSAYRLDGEVSVLNDFCNNKKVISRHFSPMQNFLIIHEPLNEEVRKNAYARGLEIFAVSPEDLCIYLTKQDKEAELQCLWTKTN